MGDLEMELLGIPKLKEKLYRTAVIDTYRFRTPGRLQLF